MVKSKWMLYTKRADFDGLSRKYGISPVMARIMRNRDVEGDDQIRKYLNGNLHDLYSPWLLKDMDQAVELLKTKIQEQKKIRIVGDYDIDGVCSTYLLLKALTRAGALVDYEIPDRVRDGYGINEAIIEAAAEDQVDTILTCDNGIAAIEQLRLAERLGMTVIITDHHDVPGEEASKGKWREFLPPAQAIVNPKQQECGYPFEGICGAVVAYKLVQALYETLQIPMEEWKAMLEIAAIATIGDVMQLKDENRIIVKMGLSQLPFTRSIGLRKLIEVCGLEINSLSAYHIGFVIGPCLNAGGRLQTAKLALNLLLCEQEDMAEQMAMELKELNEKRKDMTQEAVGQALLQAQSEYAGDKVLVLYLPECHESIAGIVAGRVREACCKPTIVLTKTEDGVKGSGRSIEAYHMFQALLEVKDLLTKFGGHPMAAGLSLNESDISLLRLRLNENAHLTEEDFIHKVWIDVPMPLEYISEKLVGELKLLEPFGQGNEKPQFAQKDLRIQTLRVLGRSRNVVKLSLATERGLVMDGILFTDGDQFVEELGDCRSLDVIYYPDVNEYNGVRTVQIVIKEYKLKT